MVCVRVRARYTIYLNIAFIFSKIRLFGKFKLSDVPNRAIGLIPTFGITKIANFDLTLPECQKWSTGPLNGDNS